MEGLRLRTLSPSELGPYRGGILHLLASTGHEFIPPLSGRQSTTQSGFSGPSSDGVESYAASLFGQTTIVATDGAGEVAGFASFAPRQISFAGRERQYHYLSTIIVATTHRRRGVMRSMYGRLIELSDEASVPVATRTWSTNEAHLGLLGKLGFSLVRREEDARGPGLDTVYLARECDEAPQCRVTAH